MIKILAILSISGSVFTMCDGGPVPEGCCDPGDRLDVIVPNPDVCEDYGGTPVLPTLCQGVDF